MKKEPERLRSTNQSPQATTATNKDDDDSNFSTQSNYKKFTDFLKESKIKAKQQQQKKTIECNCWVCKILDSSVTEADTLRYEGYNIVSETGDSIFYDPLISNLNEEGLRNGCIYVAEDKIRDIVQDELAKKHYNNGGVNLTRNEY